MRTSLLLASALSTPLIYAITSENTYNVDVLIIGGGATGTYAGLRLLDHKKSFLIVEISPNLGGHVNTFKEPLSGRGIDYGVQAYINNTETTNFFSRFNVPLVTVSQSPFPSEIVDFKTGVRPPGATAVDPTKLQGPLMNYLGATMSPEFEGISKGAYDLPKNVPQALYMPFRDFVKAHNVTNNVLQVVWIFAHGVGNLLKTPTLYVLQNFGTPHLSGLATGYLAPATAGGIQEVYDKAAVQLGDHVLFQSHVLSTTRSADGVSVVVRTPHGDKLIKASKLLVTIPPTTHNLSGFDLTDDESKVFSKWKNVAYYVGVIFNTGLRDMTNFKNVDLTKEASLPEGKFVLNLETVGIKGYHTVKVVGEPDSIKAQQMVRDAVKRIGNLKDDTTEFAAWTEHKNLQLHVDAKAIADGFYRDLYNLQGKCSTWFAGNAIVSDYSPLLWAFTEKRILPSLLSHESGSCPCEK